MKNFLALLYIVPLSLFAQVSEPAYNPSTASGARGVSNADNLYWKNPSGLIYNQIFLSENYYLVANLDSSVKVIDGQSLSLVYDSLVLWSLGLNGSTKYFWRVVEFNSSGFTAGPVWHFFTPGYNYWDDDFSTGLTNYTSINHTGSSWSISNTSLAGRFSPELLFTNSVGAGTSYLILNPYFDFFYNFLFNYSFDWTSGEFLIGIAYSLNEGVNWIPVWEQNVNQDISATQIPFVIPPFENDVKVALFCNSNIGSVGNWYIDNLQMPTPLSGPFPPEHLFVNEDSLSARLNLSWSPGSTVNPSWGYKIQRKNGLPVDTSSYQEIAWVGPNVLLFEDSEVELGQKYTYRIQTREGPGGGFQSTWSNEVTGYVPEVVPVELTSFTLSIVFNNVNLSWITSSETNNYGFQIERRETKNKTSIDWGSIGFVDGSGTSTEIKSYSYLDKNLSAGKYQYRLKQIDYDGSFDYSNVVEAEINLPIEFSLSQNYPNPFNPSTIISYQLPKAGNVTLKVFDVLGREVATLVDEYRNAGSYEVEFIASSLPSGIYFYQLKAGDYLETKKMVLIK